MEIEIKTYCNKPIRLKKSELNSPYCTHYLCVPLFPTYTTCTTITTTIIACSMFLSHNYLPFCLQTFCKQQHLCVRLYSIDPQTTTIRFTRKTGKINTDCPLTVSSCSSIVLNNQSNEYSCNRRSVFWPSREHYRDWWLSVHLHTCLSLFHSYLLLLVYVDQVRCICNVCIVYTLSLVAFAIVTF